MAKRDKSGDWYARLNRIFRGPAIKRRIRDYRQPPTSTALELFSKTQSFVYSNAINSYGQYDRLSRYADFSEMLYCLHGDTKIAVPDGYKTLKELSDEYGLDKEFIVYAYDHNKNEIVPALAKQARQTRIDHAYKVTFDSGKELIGTANHRLMLRDGTYRRIDELCPGDSMMPFYRKNLFDAKSADDVSLNDGYRWIYTMHNDSSRNNLKKGWITEHRLIAEWMAGRQLESTEVVHHKNFKKWDNRPENLEIMNETDHRRYHAEILNGNKWALENSEWIEKFKQQHSTWMRENNPMSRNDVTFGRILELAEELNFNGYKIAAALDTSLNMIKDRLRQNGFADFETFARTYRHNWRNAGHDNNREKNPRYDHSLTYKHICDAYVKGMTRNQLASVLNTTPIKITKRIQHEGFKYWNDWCENFNNHKVVSIEYYGEIPLYDLTVDGYKNFATDSVMSHNTPEISAAVDIYADETVSQDETGKVLQIYSDNRKVRRLLEDLFYDTLNIDFNLRMWVLNLVKFGDFFLFNDIAPGYGVMQVFPVPVNEIEREEGFDPEDPMAVRFRWVTQGNVALENWQLTHFRILGNDAFLPYGSSIIEPARRIWRQLVLIEDAMLVYRVVRSPERRIFYIDVGGIPPEEVPNYMAAQEAKLRSSTLVDRSTGRIDFRHNPLETLEDYFIPVRGTESGTKIDTLAGGQHVSATEDVEYIQKKLFAALKIPRAYLGYDEMLSSKATLAQEDIRFSRTIQQIQKVIISELQRLAYIHLFMNGYEGDDMFDFELKLNNPSSIAQQQKLELFARKFEIIGSALTVDDGKVFSTPFLLRSIMNMSEQQQRNMHAEVVDDVQRRAALGKISEGATPESVGFKSGGGFTPAGGAGAEPGITDDELPGGEELPEPLDAGGEDTDTGADDSDEGDEALDDLFAHNAPAGKLVVEDETQNTSTEPKLEGSYDPDEDGERQDKSSESDPVRVSMHAQTSKNKQSNRKRSQTRHGPGETHMPDFGRMTSMRDAQDDMTSRSEVGTNPLRDILNMKLETLERFGNDIRFAPEKARLYEKLDALSFLDNYMSDAEPDPEPVRPRMTTSLRAVFNQLESVFGEELQRARGASGMSGVLTETVTDSSIDDILDEVIGSYKDDVST